MIQLQRGYLLQNFVNNIPLVWEQFVIWKNILYIFLFFSSVFACGVCPSILCSFLHTNLCSYLPVASIAAIFSFNQRQIIFAVREFHEAKDIFERYFSISTNLSEKRSRLQAHFVLNYTLLAEHSHPIIAVKVIQCLLQKKTFNVRLNYPRLLLVIPYRFGHLCRLCLKKQRWKRVVNVKENIKYQEIANSIWAKYQTQQVVISSYRRGRNNCPSKRTFRTDFAVFHSSNPEKKREI